MPTMTPKSDSVGVRPAPAEGLRDDRATMHMSAQAVTSKATIRRCWSSASGAGTARVRTRRQPSVVWCLSTGKNIVDGGVGGEEVVVVRDDCV